MRAGPALQVILVSIVALSQLAAPREASATWPLFGRGLCNATSNQQHPAIAADGAGGAIVAWQDFRNPPSKIAAQHVLASGDLDPLWPHFGRALVGHPDSLINAAGGQAAAALVPDEAGGAVVVWEDNRSAATETDIFAQHVLANGKLDDAWPLNGIALCAVAGVQSGPVLVGDGAGGAIVVWMDRRPGSADVDLYAQHVLSTGLVDPRWPAGGLALATAPGPQQFPVIAADQNGGAFVAWEDMRGDPTGFDVYAQHVQGAGLVDPAWPANGLPVIAIAGDQGRPTIVADGAGGAIVAWSDGRVADTSHIFAQHVLVSGAVDPAWPVAGRALSGAAVTESRPLAAADGAGGAIVTWQGFTVDLNMFAQHVTAAGQVDPRWPTAGRALGPSHRLETNGQIASDGAGGAIVSWNEDFADVFAQHVLASGALDPAYPDTGRGLCDLPSQQGDPAIVATGDSGAIVAWTDGRNGVDNDIFAIQVLAAGTVGVPPLATPALRFDHPRPNPARGDVALAFVLSRETPVRLTVFDAAGRRVRELASGPSSAGEHVVHWDLRDQRGAPVRSGIYLARLEAEGRAFTEKLVAMR